MSQRKAHAAKVLAQIATDQSIENSDRINAANALAHMEDYLPTRWYDVDIRDLSIFFVKVVVAGAPAMLLTILLYILLAIFTQVAPAIMGL
jgi:hypothetical protein